MPLYRGPVSTVDLMSPPGALTTSPQAGGSCAANTYNNKVVAGNGFGRTTPTAGTAVVTAAANLTVRILFAQVAGAAFYDIYVSTDADPKWVGRITEAQRASGILITAVGTTGAGGVPGGVDVQVPGTGQQSATTAAVDTAYIPPPALPCALGHWVDFDLIMALTGDAASAALTIVPLLWDNDESVAGLGWFALAPVAFTFGGATGNLQSLRQRYRVDVSGNPFVAIAVAVLSGTGANLNIWSSYVR